MDLDLRRLPGPVRHAPASDQPPAHLLQRVMTALPHRPQILRPGLLPQRVQHRGQRRGALRGQVPVQLPGLTERHIQRHRPVPKPVIPSASGRAVRRAHFLGQLSQVGQVRAAGGGGQQDLVRARPVPGGQQVGPRAHRPGPRRRDPARGQRRGDRGMRGQPPHPRHRRRRRVLRDPRLPPQPALRRPVPVLLEPAARRKRRQHPRPRRDARPRPASSARRQSACSAAVSPAASIPASHASPVRAIATASAAAGALVGSPR